MDPGTRNSQPTKTRFPFLSPLYPPFYFGKRKIGEDGGVISIKIGGKGRWGGGGWMKNAP